MAELLKLISPEPVPPAPGAYVETETAREILRCLESVQAGEGEDIGIVCGAPGTGKTEAVWHFAETGAKVRVHKAVASEWGGVWNTATALCEELGLLGPTKKPLKEIRWRIAERIGSGGLLVIDEAENLVKSDHKARDDWQAFEWLRALSADFRVPLVLVGDLTLRALEEQHPKLWGRADRTIIRATKKGDVQLVGRQWGFGDAKSIELLSAVARRGGALHKVVQVCRKAHDFAGDRVPTFDHLKHAAHYLNLMQESK